MSAPRLHRIVESWFGRRSWRKFRLAPEQTLIHWSRRRRIALSCNLKCLDVVGPYEVEDSVILVHGNWIAKHCLFVILIQLKIFRVLPVRPVNLFEEAALGESHDPRRIIMDVTRFNNIILSSLSKDGAISN